MPGWDFFLKSAHLILVETLAVIASPVVVRLIWHAHKEGNPKARIGHHQHLRRRTFDGIVLSAVVTAYSA